MHPKVLAAEGWKKARTLARRNLLDGWFLAGGTGLAIQLGHRVSDDLDFFFPGPFDEGALLEQLVALGKVRVQSRAPGTLHITLDGWRLSFLKTQAPFLFPGTAYRELQLADPRDIAVMKVIAIGGRGSRKDFVDLYFFLKAGGSLESVFDLLRRRFRGLDYNEYHLLRSLVWFEDAETEPLPRMLRQACWPDIKAAILDEVRRLS